MSTSKSQFSEAWRQAHDALFQRVNDGKTTVHSTVFSVSKNVEGKDPFMRIKTTISTDIKARVEDAIPTLRISTSSTELLSRKAGNTLPPERMYAEIECLTHETYMQIRGLIEEVLRETKVMESLDVKKIGVGIDRSGSWYAKILASIKMSENGKSIDKKATLLGNRALRQGKKKKFVLHDKEAAVKLCQQIAELAKSRQP